MPSGLKFYCSPSCSATAGCGSFHLVSSTYQFQSTIWSRSLIAKEMPSRSAWGIGHLLGKWSHETHSCKLQSLQQPARRKAGGSSDPLQKKLRCSIIFPVAKVFTRSSSNALAGDGMGSLQQYSKVNSLSLGKRIKADDFVTSRDKLRSTAPWQSDMNESKRCACQSTMGIAWQMI